MLENNVKFEVLELVKPKSSIKTNKKTVGLPWVLGGGVKDLLPKETPKNILSEVTNQLEKRSIAIVPTLGLIESPLLIVAKDLKSKSPLEWRRYYGALAKSFLPYEEIVFSLPKSLKGECLKAALVGLHQATYSFDHYKKNKSVKLKKIYLQVANVDQKKSITEVLVLSESISHCRDLVNTPAEDMGPDQFESAARKLSKSTGLKIKVLGEAACEKEKMGSLLAVGRASHRESRLLIVDWQGDKKKKSFEALCGKGVCFDTGGLDIKPPSSMILMRKDMGGAGTVLATMLTLAKLKIKKNIRAYIPLVENSIGPDAFRPSDILTACDGQTIEIGHTDAEGRLILADAIAYADKQGAQSIISVATLTGAAAVALGKIHVPIMGDKNLIKKIEKGAKISGEKIWELPMDDEHKNLVKGKCADLTNSDGSGQAGCITAGAFLSYFSHDTPFAHCDISPASWQNSSHVLGPAGATGILVSTLLEGLR